MFFLHNIHVKLAIQFFSGGEDRQELLVPVEVSSPDGNFDTFGKSFFASL
jgi:hypothetical protein